MAGLYIALVVSIITTVAAAKDVRIPPHIEHQELGIDFLVEGKVITLPCRATGTPKPTYSWTLNGEKLGRNERGITWTGEGDITLEPYRYGLSEVFYQCKANNTWGASLSTVFHIRRPKIDIPGGTDIEEEHRSVGEALELKRGDLKSVPLPVFTWQTIKTVDDKNPQAIALDRRVLMSMGGDLYFTYILKEDEKLYKLSAFNNIIDTIKGGRYTQIIVDDGTLESRAPSPLYPPFPERNVTVVEGEELELQCIFSGYPLVEDITWKSPNDFPFTPYKENNTLRVNRVTRNYEGKFTCTAGNTEGENHIDINVDVQTRPKFAAGGRPKSVNKTEGESVTFRCQASDDTEPAADIKWFFNGEKVDVSSPGPRTDFTDNRKELRIVRLDRDTDIRVIQCNASNKHGYVFTEAMLNVLERTRIRTGPEDQFIFPNTTLVAFECLVTSDPLTPVKISWTLGGKPVEEYTDLNMTIANNRRKLLLNLEGLDDHETDAYLGVYECTASNGYSNETIKAKLMKEIEVVPAVFPIWIIILLVVLMIILLLIISCCLCYRYLKNNEGDIYFVDDVERKQGNDPLLDIENDGFHDYQRPETEAPSKKASSRATLDSRTLDSRSRSHSRAASEATDSMAEFGDDMGMFTEDGSFQGQYIEGPRKQIKL